MHLGIVAPLPFTPTGPAESMAAALPFLTKHATITCFVGDLDAVDPALRERYDVRHVSERHDPAIDVLVYHLGNNPDMAFSFHALMEGPTGLVEIHDGSLHHFIQDTVLGRGQDPIRYAEYAAKAHGHGGRRLAEMRWRRYQGTIEMFLYDYLRPAVDRSIGAIVHSDYARDLVRLRAPRTRTWTIPLPAPELPAPTGEERAWTGIPPERLLIAHLGFVTTPKRPFVYLGALRQIIDRGVDAHLAFVGKDEMGTALTDRVAELGLQDHVTVTGFLDTPTLERWLQAVDVVVNLRAPHVGESSGSLSYGLAAGKAIVVQPVGSWAEIPDDVVVRLPVTDDDTTALADTLFALGQDGRLRDRFGDAAARYANEHLGAHDCAEQLVQAAKAALDEHVVPAAWAVPNRADAVRTFLESGSLRTRAFLADAGALADACAEALLGLEPASVGARLLAVDAPPTLLHLLVEVWGYTVDARSTSAHVAEQLVLAPQPGIDGCTVDVLPWADDDQQIASYDAIVIGALSRFSGDRLAQWNAALLPQGSLVLLDSHLSEEELEVAGFSTHLHHDTLVAAFQSNDRRSLATIATKAGLPAATA